MRGMNYLRGVDFAPPWLALVVAVAFGLASLGSGFLWMDDARRPVRTSPGPFASPPAKAGLSDFAEPTVICGVCCLAMLGTWRWLRAREALRRASWNRRSSRQ